MKADRVRLHGRARSSDTIRESIEQQVRDAFYGREMDAHVHYETVPPPDRHTVRVRVGVREFEVRVTEKFDWNGDD